MYSEIENLNLNSDPEEEARKEEEFCDFPSVWLHEGFEAIELRREIPERMRMNLLHEENVVFGRTILVVVFLQELYGGDEEGRWEQGEEKLKGEIFNWKHSQDSREIIEIRKTENRDFTINEIRLFIFLDSNCGKKLLFKIW